MDYLKSALEIHNRKKLIEGFEECGCKECEILLNKTVVEIYNIYNNKEV